jgi:Spy/CpxP family protein refolding chaperone
MQIRFFVLAYGVLAIFGVSAAVAQDKGAAPSARQQLQSIHTPQSIEQELDRLTKDLQLTREQQQQIRPLLQEHHDKIRALLDKNPNASRYDLGPQIHGISDETHREIHALLTDQQKQLEKAMREREDKGQENRKPAPPPAPPSDRSLSTT